MNASDTLTLAAVRTIAENARVAARERGIASINGMSANNWLDAFIARLNGNEPLFRLVFVLVSAMNSSGILLADVLAEDTALFVQCLLAGDIAPYHTQHPPL
jgi:hypothetical protein